MRSAYRRAAVSLFLFLPLSQVARALCPPDQPATTIFFVNGVNVEKNAARDALDLLEEKVRTATPNTPLDGQCLDFQLAYNQHDPYLNDFRQAAIQILGGELSKFWRYFANLEAAPDWFQTTAQQLEGAINLTTYVVDTDLQQHIAAYVAEIQAGHKIVLVPHSQGNLYANEAYAIVGAPNVFRIVSVATPASFVAGNGPYTTLFEDLIATLAFLVANPNRLPPNETNDNPLCSPFWSCHSFLDSYLAGNASGPRILDQILGQAPSVPTLINPINGAAIPQNNPNVGCAFDPARGYGLQIQFDWTDSFSSDGIAGYDIVAQLQGAIPIVQTFVNASAYTLTKCNAFVADSNLQNWQWRVRAKSGAGTFGPWTDFALFTFDPCRLADGSPCFAPP